MTKVHSSPRLGAKPSSSSSPSPHSPEDSYGDPDNDNQPRSSVINIRDTIHRNTGLFLITLSQCCFSSMNVAVKKLNGLETPVPMMELIVVRMFLTGLFSLSYMIVTGVDRPFFGPKDLRLLLLLRGISGYVGLTGFYFSLQYLSLSDATVLTFLAPISLVFTGAIFLGESFYLRQVLAGLVSLSGVILIARPSFLFGPNSDIPHLWIDIDPVDSVVPTDRILAVCVALVGVVGATTAYTTIRAIGKRAHAVQSMLYYSTTCVFGSVVSMIVTGTPIVIPTSIEWLLLLVLIGIFGFMALLLLTKGFQCETVGRGSMAMYTQIIFATFFQRIFFHSYPTLYSAVGIILISGSAFYIAISKATSGETKTTGDIRLPDDDHT